MKLSTIIDWTGLISFITLLSHLTIDFNWNRELLYSMIYLLPIALFCADLLSGMIHWICDSFGSSDTYLWGAIVEPFRSHHKDPSNIVKIPLSENLGVSCLLGSLLLSAITILDETFHHDQWTCFLILFIVLSVLSNLFHRWAHISIKNRPPWLRLLQRLRIAISPEEHLVHHRTPHRNNYCIMCGWANILTNRVNWSRIEHVLDKIGIKTNFD
ncbi:MAG: hypothetical protein HRU19_30435 [Pseudobacteriovorax sp.]|nr:hypothetical protein [Pseudobacteriovorax sp.]